MSNATKYRGVVFDLDGTLVNSLEDLADSMNEVLKTRNFSTHPVESYKYFVGDGLKNLVIRSLPENHKINSGMIETCMGEMRQTYSKRWHRKSRLYDSIPELLTNLSEKGIKLAICSNKPDSFTIEFYNYFLKSWDFASVIGAREELPLKPDPTGALISAKKMALPVEEILYLGDTATDMQTAKNANMHAVGVLWGFRQKEELLESGADLIISHPRELMPLI